MEQDATGFRSTFQFHHLSSCEIYRPKNTLSTLRLLVRLARLEMIWICALLVKDFLAFSRTEHAAPFMTLRSQDEPKKKLSPYIISIISGQSHFHDLQTPIFLLDRVLALLTICIPDMCPLHAPFMCPHASALLYRNYCHGRAHKIILSACGDLGLSFYLILAIDLSSILTEPLSLRQSFAGKNRSICRFS